MSFASLAGARIPHQIVAAAGVNTLLLLHFEGDFVDATGRHGTLLAVDVNDTISSTAQIGTGALSYAGLDGVGTVSADPLISDFEFGTGDFTIEFFYRTQSADSTSRTMSFLSNLGSVLWRVSLNGVGEITATGRLSFGTRGGSLTAGTGTAIDLTSYAHFAVVREAGVLTLYVNGASVATSSFTTDITFATLAPGETADRLFVGAYPVDVTDSGFRLLDEVRVSNIARYSGAFTPTTVPFVVD